MHPTTARSLVQTYRHDAEQAAEHHRLARQARASRPGPAPLAMIGGVLRRAARLAPHRPFPLTPVAVPRRAAHPM